MVTQEKVFNELTELKKLITQQQLQKKDILTFTEAANYLDLSESYLYQLISKGVVPCYKPNGKKLYFSRQELTDWVLSNKQQSRYEIETEVDELFINHKKQLK